MYPLLSEAVHRLRHIHVKNLAKISIDLRRGPFLPFSSLDRNGSAAEIDLTCSYFYVPISESHEHVDIIIQAIPDFLASSVF
jgi:hypothetical protein